MDLTPDSFSFHLPRILDELATCCFVALDFEFSGIAINNQRQNTGPQTLQQRYSEAKRAADKYQILQVGLTICHEDIESGTYTLKPYNLYLNPIIDKRLEIERDWTFQSSAVEFLLENKFRMDLFYKNGVHFLSREEEHAAIARATERNDRTAKRILDVKETDYESINFLKAARRLIDDWLAVGNGRDNYLNIPPPSRAGDSPKSKNDALPFALNRFQKRLVHQLVEVEYPSLVTISRAAFIQIIDYDEKRENAIKEQRLRRTEERVWKQIGFRWIAEALAGGDLSHLDPGYFEVIMESSRAVGSTNSLSEFSEKLKQRLKVHRPVLVGHNLFMDLVYFCRCFLGPLPDKVEDFQAMANKLFPMLMDTKYMATHDCGSINPTSSLSEINDSLAQIETPRINIHHHHTKYNTQQIDHEAGYDSLLTAQVFIKLSAQLRDGGVSEKSDPAILAPPRTLTPGSITKDKPGSKVASLSDSKPAHKKPTKQLRTRFDLLQVEESLDSQDAIPEPRLPFEDSPGAQDKVNRGQLIPRLGAEFWKVYGNKLRVFGTEERVCIIG